MNSDGRPAIKQAPLSPPDGISVGSFLSATIDMYGSTMTKYLTRFIKQQPFLSGLIVLFLTWGSYFFYLWPRLFYWTQDGIEAGWIGIYGDWAAHMAYASVFAYRPATLWLTAHPLYYDQKFTYPFAADMLSGLLIRLGIDPVAAFVVPSILLTLMLLFALYAFFVYQLKSIKQALLPSFSLAVVLVGGGFGRIFGRIRASVFLLIHLMSTPISATMVLNGSTSSPANSSLSEPFCWEYLLFSAI
jgi:hypothetical protein